ncbi:pectin lyase fold/virulence factor [Phaeosphaeria sp. MPI-PUGE-AT-0046c]|nr:pectin lyase fold/virulence factor [Phaeosphaeria sp. MPI-PUGE-AT-0046c]
MPFVGSFGHILLASFAFAKGQALGHLSRRGICTVPTNNDPLIDDAPSIRAALQACGDSGTTILAAEHAYYIHSPIDLSPCRRCQIQIDGSLNLGISNMTSDWDYWQKQSAIFKISNTSNVVITSSGTNNIKGTIDTGGYGCGSGPGAWKRGHGPVLFDISNGSAQIYIRNLLLRYVPCTLFRIRAGSSAIHISDIHNLIATDEAVVIEDSQHVYIDNSIIRTIGTCLAMGPNTSNVQIIDSRCDAIKHPWRDTPPNGFEMRLGSSDDDSLIDNIMVKDIVVTGSGMNIVGFEEVAQYASEPHRTTIKNATFINIDFGGASPRQAVFIGPHRGALTATDISFRSFIGAKPSYSSDLECKNPEDECSFFREDWPETYLRFDKVAASSELMGFTERVNDEPPQDTQQDVTKSPLMDLYNCNHHIAPALKENLVDREAYPACLVNYHIKVITDLQEVLDRRGGIFASKTSGVSDELLITHNDCIRLWAVVKVECYQDISLLEGICGNDPEQGKQWGIQDALRIWYQARPKFARVPGCSDTFNDRIKAGEREGLDHNLSVGQLPDMRKGDNHAEKMNLQHDEAKPRDKVETSQSVAQVTPTPKAQEFHRSEDNVLKDAEDITQQLDQSMSFRDWVIFDEAAGLSPPADAPLTASSPPVTPPPRTALRSNRPATPFLQPRTTFAEQTTVIPQNFRYGGVIDRKPHNKHTSAEEARRQNHFHRTPKGFEKENSSHFKTSWYKYELMMKTGKWAEKEAVVVPKKEDEDESSFAKVVRKVEDSLLARRREKAKRVESLAAVTEEVDEEAVEEEREAKKNSER